jgi:hypothetical protein
MKYLLGIMGGLELSDGLLTDSLVRNGVVREANRLMEPVIMGGDFLLLKVLGIIISGLALWYIYRKYPLIAVTATSGIVAFYGAVTVWNLGVFLAL